MGFIKNYSYKGFICCLLFSFLNFIIAITECRAQDIVESAYKVNIQSLGAKSGLSILPAVNDLAFLKAIKLLKRKGGGIITIPQGTYYISKSIVLENNQILRGINKQKSIIKLANNSFVDVVTNAAKDNLKTDTSKNCFILIEHLTIDGNKVNNKRLVDGAIKKEANAGLQKQAGIHFENIRNSRIDDCIVLNCAWNGIAVGAGENVIIKNTLSSKNGNNNVPYFQQFEAMGILIWNNSANGMPCKNVSILKCSANENQKHGIEVYGPTNETITIDNCSAISNNGAGIVINCLQDGMKKINNATLSNSTCNDNVTSGIMVFGNGIKIINCLVSGNNYGNAYFNTNNKLGGLSLSAIEGSGFYIEITKNTVIDNIPHKRIIEYVSEIRGISLDGYKSVISNNRVINAYGRGILASNNRVTISNNLISYKNYLNTNLCLSGIALQFANGDTIDIINNQIVNASQNGIYLETVKGFRIEKNVIKNSGRMGMEVYNSYNGAIAGNVIYGSGKIDKNQAFGIRVYNSKELVVYGNESSDIDSVASQSIGIYIDGNSSKVNIYNNKTKLNKHNSIFVSPTTSEVKVKEND
jgi:parallel beta-helix repeat protein